MFYNILFSIRGIITIFSIVFMLGGFAVGAYVQHKLHNAKLTASTIIMFVVGALITAIGINPSYKMPIGYPAAVCCGLLLLFFGFCILVFVLFSHKIRLMYSDINVIGLSSLIISFIFILIIVILISLAPSGDGSMHSFRCSICNREFDDPDDMNFITMHGMCENCYDNYKYSTGR